MPARAELVWDGKYDATGQRNRPLRVKLPFQTVETVNESMADRQSLFRASAGESPWRNRLIWGDKKYVLPVLLDELAGQVNLIYIDPPFDTGADFSFTATVPGAPEDDGDDSGVSFEKQPSVLEQKAYRDTWGRGLDSYLQWFYETAVFLHELLHADGSLYVHLDYHVCHYAKCILDEIFGPELLHNEVIWKRTSAHSDANTFNHVHDVIYFYSKSEEPIWNEQYTAYDPAYEASKYSHVDSDGRRYRLDNITSPHPRPNMTYVWKGHAPPDKGWRYSKETMAQLDKEGRIWYPSDKSKRPQLKRYLDEGRGRLLDSLWSDIPPVNSQANERVAYATQKPEALLERIIKASSNEGDLVLDCFCGSGTTAAVAEKLNRRWVACDLGRFAIHTTRKRLLGIEGLKPFVVQNLGKYERQLWQEHEFRRASRRESHDDDIPSQTTLSCDLRRDARQRAYIDFILKLYHATPINGRTWVHGAKAGRMVHVGTVDSPVSPDDVRQIVKEFKQSIGTGKDAPKTNGVDVLGWDFAFETNEITRQQAEAASVQVRFLRIPREAMDKKAVEQGDVKFFELNHLALKEKIKGRKVTLELLDFVIPPDDVPADVQGKIDHFSQWIDFWAVDWDHTGDSFHNMWQSFRTRAEPKLRLSADHTYDEPGEYTVMVKVIDILGNDTTQVVRVKVK